MTSTADRRKLVPSFGAAATVIAMAALSAGYVVFRGTGAFMVSDFDQLWYAAKATLAGLSPYHTVGPGLKYDWDWFYYPMPAVLLAAPFAFLPLLVARGAFAALSAALLAAACLREDRTRLLAFLSAPTLIALGRGQASPLLVASAAFPLLAWFAAYKPNIGLAILPVSRSIRTAIIAGSIGAVVLLAVSFVLEPTWVEQWREVLSHKRDMRPPILRTGGWLILLALFRWRRAEAWLILILGCVPQTPSLYDMLPLFLVANGARQVAVLALGGNVGFLALVSGIGFPREAIFDTRVTTLAVLFMFLPAIVLLLLRPARPADKPASPRQLARADFPLLAALLISAFFAAWGTVFRYRM